MIKKFTETLKNFIKNNKLEFILISLVIILALFLRLYRIGDFMTFLGDEGRDVRIVRDLITKGNLVFIGPQTSIGNMYLGPLYYYMMAPALLLSCLNPVGPAVMIALLSTLTVFLTYYLGRKWFGKWSGLIAGLLYAVSPVAIIYSRSSWNPNPMPLFALLCVWGIYEVWKNKKLSWLPFIGIFFAAALQMHYLGLLLAPTLGLYWIFTLKDIKLDKKKKSVFVKNTLLAIFLFLLLMSPLLLFDIKHNWMNLNAFKAFFSDRQTTINLNPARSDRFIPVISGAVQDLILGRQDFAPGLVGLAILIAFLFAYWKSKAKSPYNLLILWIVFGFLGLGVYKQHIYIHYLGFLYPCFYLIVGATIGYFIDKPFPRCFPFALSLAALTVTSLIYSPTFQNPNRQLQRTEQAVDSIIKESGGQPFNFGLIAKQNYDESYRYFFENKKANMFRGSDKITSQLFVICEDGDSCQPEGNPAYEIAIFGPSHIVKQWNIDYLKLYKLIHTTK